MVMESWGKGKPVPHVYLEAMAGTKPSVGTKMAM